MKLLVVTQKIDVNDPVLGFFHGWVKEFSKHCEKITVIALGTGEFKLPENVGVLSLGKEAGFSKARYILNFYKYIWSERNNYDAVFVHMNQEYVLLGAELWWLMGKKIMLWRNHSVGGLLTNLAVLLSDRVFCTSKYSYTAKFKKTEIMPVGIDTDLFMRDEKIKRHKNSILFLGRISPVKKIEILIRALAKMKRSGVLFDADIVGNALPKDQQYLEELKSIVRSEGLDGVIHFKSGVTNKEAIETYNKYEAFINMTQGGSMDKTIFEAMACEALVITSNPALMGSINGSLIFKEDSAEDLAKKISDVLSWSDDKKQNIRNELRSFCVGHHSLTILAKKLFYPKI